LWSPFNNDWEENFLLLQKFSLREAHTQVPRGRTRDEDKLALWVVAQRSDRRAGNMTDDRCARLEALPGWSWDPITDRWEEGFSHLQEFALRESHTRVPQGFIENEFRLGQWVSAQRSAGTSNKLSDDRIQRLEALPGWVWDSRVADWEEAFELLKQFTELEGHSLISRSAKAGGFSLGAWTRHQRVRFKDGGLSGSQIRRLEALPGWQWDRSRKKQ
jgi:hypothetical protein